MLNNSLYACQAKRLLTCMHTELSNCRIAVHVCQWVGDKYAKVSSPTRTNLPEVAYFGIVTITQKHGMETRAEQTARKERWLPFSKFAKDDLLHRATGWPTRTYQATTATVAPNIVPLPRVFKISQR